MAFCKSKTEGLVYFTKVAPYAPNRLPKIFGRKKTNSTPTKFAPKDLEFQQVFGSPVDFLLQSPGSEFTVVLVGQGRKKFKHTVDGSEIRRENSLIWGIRNYLQGFLHLKW